MTVIMVNTVNMFIMVIVIIIVSEYFSDQIRYLHQPESHQISHSSETGVIVTCQSQS